MTAPREISAPDNPASQRWHRLVSDRLEEMQRLTPEVGSFSGGFWDRRADRYAASANLIDTERDPLLRRLRAVTDRSSTAIDVGAGTGRYALALASHVRHIAAVDPSGGMLDVLQRDAAELGVSNLTATLSSWEQAEIEAADVAFSAFVLPLVPDARAFLLKLDAAARHHVFLYLGAYCGDAVLDPLWRHFHGAPRAPAPTYLDALAVLRELGITPEVEVVEIPNRRRFRTVDEAVEHYRDGLLVANTPEVKAELEALLAIWLLGRKGSLRSPLRTVPAAVIHWRPGTNNLRFRSRSM